jgi:murein DD-endopeptidase MepM/ murein hydrolase activator NlpD
MKCILLLCILCLLFPISSNFNYIYLPSFPTIPGTPVTQRFGAPGPKGPHVGVDFTLPVGSPVYACMTGWIINTGIDNIYGRFIMLEHAIDGYVSVYGHLSAIKVKEGAFVISGQLIGLSGGDKKKDPEGAGQSSAPHLHFEVRVPGHIDNNKYNIDPMKYLESVKNKYKNFEGHISI